MRLRKLCFAYLIAFASAAVASASTITTVISGTVYSGTNGSGGSGKVFGTGTNLAGLPFTLTFTFDDTQGEASGYACSDGGWLYYSELASSGVSNPGTAILSITDASNNVWSYQFGGASLGGPPATSISSITSSAQRYQGKTPSGAGNCYGYSYDNYVVNVSYGSGYSGYAQISAEPVPAGGSSGTISNSADWRAPITLADLDGTFEPYFSIYTSTTGTRGSLFAYANGYLTPSTISVSSPGYSLPTSEAANWRQWYSTVAPSAAIGQWLQTLAVPSSRLANIYSSWQVQEFDARPGTDSCNAAAAGTNWYYSGGTHVTGSTWHVTSSNIWGNSSIDSSEGQYDSVGEPDYTETYKGTNYTFFDFLRTFKASSLPCSNLRYQQMKIDFGDGNGLQAYGSKNTLTGKVDTADVYAGKSNDSTSPHSKVF